MPSLTALNEWGPSDPPHHATWRPRRFGGVPVVEVQHLDFSSLPVAKHAPEWTTSGHAHWDLGWFYLARLDCAHTLRDLQ